MRGTAQVARRGSSGGWGAVFGVFLLLGVVIQVVKLLVIPLTILAIGLMTRAVYASS